MKIVLVVTLFLSAPLLASDEDQLFIVIGGRSSCASSSVTQNKSPYGMGLVRPFLELIKIKPNTNYILACLFTSPPPKGNMVFVKSEEPNKLIESSSTWLINEIKDKAIQNPNLEVTLIGHSYGGWLSMYLSLKLESEISFNNLFTIDPISPEGCYPSAVISGSAGCHQAPKDLDDLLIRNSVKQWINFFQTQDTWISSSKINDAHENHHIRYRGPHTSIDDDKRVWDIILNKI